MHLRTLVHAVNKSEIAGTEIRISAFFFQFPCWIILCHLHILVKMHEIVNRHYFISCYIVFSLG